MDRPDIQELVQGIPKWIARKAHEKENSNNNQEQHNHRRS